MQIIHSLFKVEYFIVFSLQQSAYIHLNRSRLYHQCWSGIESILRTTFIRIVTNLYICATLPQFQRLDGKVSDTLYSRLEHRNVSTCRLHHGEFQVSTSRYHLKGRYLFNRDAVYYVSDQPHILAKILSRGILISSTYTVIYFCVIISARIRMLMKHPSEREDRS